MSASHSTRLLLRLGTCNTHAQGPGCVCALIRRKNNHMRSWSGSELTGGDLGTGGLPSGTGLLPASALGLAPGLLLLVGGDGKPPLLLSLPLPPLLPADEPQYW